MQTFRRLLFTFYCIILSSNLFAQDSSYIKQWTEDIDYYHKTLAQKHIDLYHKISEEDFAKEIHQIKSSVYNSSESEIILQLMALTRKIGDGHTSFPIWGIAHHKYPLAIQKFGNDWRVIQVSRKHQHLLGKKLIKIDDVTIHKIIEKVAPVSQFVENKQSEKTSVAYHLKVAEILFTLGITKKELEATFMFMDDAGQTYPQTLKAIESKQYESSNFAKFEIAHPSIEKPDSSTTNKLWFSPIGNRQAVYIKFGAYPSFEGMNTFATEVLTHLKINATKQLVIDLRGNGGGDFFIGLVLASYLNLADAINWKSGVYVLTDAYTFSAAMNNAAHFRQILHAQIAGEATGGNPVGYQDMDSFTLPHAQLTVTYSKRFFQFQDKFTAGIQPDITIQPDWESYQKGMDTVLDRVIQELD